MKELFNKCKNRIALYWKKFFNWCKEKDDLSRCLLLGLICLCAVWCKWFAVCAVISFAMVVVLVVQWCIGRARRRRTPPLQPQRRQPISALAWTGFLVAAACLLRFAVYGNAEPDVSAGVRFFNALFESVRLVGIVEDYDKMMLALRVMVHETLNGAPVVLIWIVKLVAYAYATALNVFIPVAGSAFVLDVFAKAFPSVALRWKTKTAREHCYFSALNPQSLALAKSLLEEAGADAGKRTPLIIFTDAYVDDESEQSSELMLEAKRIGAVCIRDDLAHVFKRRRGDRGERKYFLMEESEYDNLPALMSLMEDRNVPYIKHASIYLFVQGDLYIQLEKNLKDRLVFAEKKLTEDEFPAIIPINAHRNLVNNLMEQVPLYEPLVGKNTDQLTITILGNGSIGTEAFLSAYWCSRMLVSGKNEKGEDTIGECKVTIHVVSQDDEETFLGKIDSINPEMRRTMQAGDPLLQWRPDRFNEPYCTIQYHKADVKVAKIDEGKQGGTLPVWMDADYVIVALGDDASNIAVANSLRTRIGKYHLEQQDDPKNTVLAYVVYNTELCESLNGNNTAEYGVYMYAFGDLNQVYSAKNVFMTENQERAEQAHKAYYGHNAAKPGGQVKKHSVYDRNAEMARALHIRYKLFSLGWIHTSLFNSKEEDHTAAVDAALAQYERVAKIGRAMMPAPVLYSTEALPVLEHQAYLEAALSAEDLEKWKDLCRKRHYLAWLEHRRWCAYTRTMGYRFTAAFNKYYVECMHHKNDTLKLHPCLVEARFPSKETKETYVFSSDAYWKTHPDNADPYEDANADALDVHHILRFRAQTEAWYVLLKDPLEEDPEKRTPQQQKHYANVLTLKGNMESASHCKYYDYFTGEFPKYMLGHVLLAQIQHYLPIQPDEWEELCEKWKDSGAFICESGWVVPVDCVLSYIKDRYALSIDVSQYRNGYDLAEGAIPDPFLIEFEAKFYAVDTPENQNKVNDIQKTCDAAVHCAILEEQAAVAAHSC